MEAIPDRSRALVGFRAWRLIRRDGVPGLRALSFHYGDTQDTWSFLDLEAKAQCGWAGTKIFKYHETPDPSCQCGIYALSTIPPLKAQLRCFPRPITSPLIMGVVALEGRIVRWTEGCRAERATVLGLFEKESLYSNYPPDLRVFEDYYSQPIFEDYYTRLRRAGNEIPVELPTKDFLDLNYARQWANERHCDLYADTVNPGEEVRCTRT